MRASVLEEIQIDVLPRVYAPQTDTLFLSRHLPSKPGGQMLDLCSGSGAIALSAAALGWHATAVDICPRAVLNIKLNAYLNRLEVKAHEGDLFQPVVDRRFDLITVNPPYVPVPEGIKVTRGVQAWDGGRDGRKLIRRICAETVSYLNPGGAILMVQSSLADIEQTEADFQAQGLLTERLESVLEPFGPISHQHADYFESIGCIRRNERIETLTVLRACKPTASFSSVRSG